MTRKIKERPAVVEHITPGDLGDVKGWLQDRAIEHSLCWLLAHADDGVIWGKVEQGALTTSHEAAQGDGEAENVWPPLRVETLQQARLFSKHAELLLWRDGDNVWHARLFRQPAEGEMPAFTEAIDEPQMVWGTHPRPLGDGGFTLMSDGAQGLRHAVPLAVTGAYNEQNRPLRLWVRHYIGEDETGFARIVASRLVDLTLEVTQ